MLSWKAVYRYVSIHSGTEQVSSILYSSKPPGDPQKCIPWVSPNSNNPEISNGHLYVITPSPSISSERERTMIIGACTLELYLPGVASLKEKRSRLKPLLNDIRRRYNIAAAEIDKHDIWQSADIAIVAVANDSNHIYAVLEKTVHWIEEQRFDVEVLDWTVELR